MMDILDKLQEASRELEKATYHIGYVLNILDPTTPEEANAQKYLLGARLDTWKIAAVVNRCKVMLRGE